MSVLSVDPKWLAGRAAELEVMVAQAKHLNSAQNARFGLLYKNLYTGNANIEGQRNARADVESILSAAGLGRLVSESQARVDLALSKSGSLIPGLSYCTEVFARDGVIGLYAQGLGVPTRTVAALRNPWAIGITGKSRP